MARRRWPLVLALLAACGDDGGAAADGPPTTAPRAAATVPAEVDAGRGALVLDGRATVLDVVACTFEPATDPATGVTTELSVSAEDGTGLAVDVVRSTVPGTLVTVTDTVVVTDAAAEALEASRAERSGVFLDLRDPDADEALLDTDPAARTVRASGVFGPRGALADAPANVEGELVLRC